MRLRSIGCLGRSEFGRSKTGVGVEPGWLNDGWVVECVRKFDKGEASGARRMWVHETKALHEKVMFFSDIDGIHEARDRVTKACNSGGACYC